MTRLKDLGTHFPAEPYQEATRRTAFHFRASPSAKVFSMRVLIRQGLFPVDTSFSPAYRPDKSDLKQRIRYDWGLADTMSAAGRPTRYKQRCPRIAQAPSNQEYEHGTFFAQRNIPDPDQIQIPPQNARKKPYAERETTNQISIVPLIYL